MRKVQVFATVVVVAIGLTTLAPASWGGDGGLPPPSGPDQGADGARIRSNTPTFKTFSSTSLGGTRVVISIHGNITSFASPNNATESYDHIGAGTVEEGYVLCYTPSGLGQFNSYDVGWTESGFGAATTSSGPPVTVTRTTSDGRVRLKQTFTFSGARRSLQIKMDVTNLTGSTMSGVTIRRHADLDISTGGSSGTGDFANDFANTFQAVIAWENYYHGMVMRPMQPVSGSVFGYIVSNVTTSCGFSSWGSPTIGADLSGAVFAPFGSLAAGATKSLTVIYERN